MCVSDMELKTCPSCGKTKVRRAFKRRQECQGQIIMVEKHICNKCDRDAYLLRHARQNSEATG